MRKALLILMGVALLPGRSAYAAETTLSLTCITRDLPAGAQVWLEVQPEYRQTTVPTLATLGRESAAPERASGDSVWQLDVPAGGSITPATHHFTFPVDLERTSTEHVASIYLKVRFKVDAPGRQGKGAYGEVLETTFGMPVPPGKAPLSRCLRLREAGDKLIAETAPDCSDAAFASLRHGTHRLRLRPPQPQP